MVREAFGLLRARVDEGKAKGMTESIGVVYVGMTILVSSHGHTASKQKTQHRTWQNLDSNASGMFRKAALNKRKVNNHSQLGPDAVDADQSQAVVLSLWSLSSS